MVLLGMNASSYHVVMTNPLSENLNNLKVSTELRLKIYYKRTSFQQVCTSLRKFETEM